MVYYDAHLHLQDPRLAGVLDELPRLYAQFGVGQVVVNGTSPEDWPDVLALAQRFDCVIPSFGLHPWRVNAASTGWQDGLLKHLDAAEALGRPVGIGECGLDKWIRDYDLDKQKAAFQWQLDLATERKLPLSIHCLQAWGSLRDMLSEKHPARGFLLHSYGGPAEMVPGFVELGAYFSFSGYFARPDKTKKLEAFRQVPWERLLIETDAPDMLPPPEGITHPLPTDGDKDAPNHPANIANVYELAAGCLGVGADILAKQCEVNFARLFSHKGTETQSSMR